MVKIRVDVETLDLVQTFDLIFGFSANTIAFKDSDVEVSAKTESVKILTC